MTINEVMPREVCLKHRKNRRETILRVRTPNSSWQRCLFFLSFSGAGAHKQQPAPLICDHRPKAGCLNAIQAMPVQLRLIAPIFITTRRAPACAAWSPKPRLFGATPRRRANFSNRGVAKRKGNGLISRPCAGSTPAPATILLGCSIIQEVTCLASGRARCKAVAVHQTSR
jgi:hypothetical protein